MDEDHPSVSLVEQVRLFELRWERVLVALRNSLDYVAYRRYLHDLAYQRLLEGYELYGDKMYRWSEACRERNADEEVADAIVYLTSGASEG